MRLKEKNLLQKFAATLKKFSAQGAKKVEYGIERDLDPAVQNIIILLILLIPDLLSLIINIESSARKMLNTQK